MPDNQIRIDVFADEGSRDRDKNHAREILAVTSALGIKFWTPRLVWSESEGRNVNLTTTNDRTLVREVKKMSDDYGLRIISLGSPLMKVKLFDVDDGNKVVYQTENQVIDTTKWVIENAHALGATCVRGFSGYGVRADHVDVKKYDSWSRGVALTRKVAEMLGKERLAYHIEPETGLVMHDAETMTQGEKQMGLRNVGFIHDPANVHLQGLNAYMESMLLKQSKKLAGMHAKFYGESVGQSILPSQEHAMRNHVPVGSDESGGLKSLEMITENIKTLNKFAHSLGSPGFCITLEPHLAGAGTFRGHSTPAGMGLAYHALEDALKNLGANYTKETFPSFREREMK